MPLLQRLCLYVTPALRVGKEMGENWGMGSSSLRTIDTACTEKRGIRHPFAVLFDSPPTRYIYTYGWDKRKLEVFWHSQHIHLHDGFSNVLHSQPRDIMEHRVPQLEGLEDIFRFENHPAPPPPYPPPISHMIISSRTSTASISDCSCSKV